MDRSWYRGCASISKPKRRNNHAPLLFTLRGFCKNFADTLRSRTTKNNLARHIPKTQSFQFRATMKMFLRLRCFFYIQFIESHLNSEYTEFVKRVKYGGVVLQKK